MLKKLREYGKIWIIYVMYVIFFPLRLFPIKQKSIMFTSLTGGKYIEYSCNPKYIYEYFRDHVKENYKIIWAFSYPENYQFLLDENVILVKHFTIKTFYYLLTCKVVITNGSYVSWFPFRKKQTIIHTWHGGGAYKRLDTGSDNQKKIIERRNAFVGKNTSLFVTSSEAFSKYVIRGAFRFFGEILNCGMPRNDQLILNHTESSRKKIQKWYNLGNERVLLYAPTYRKDDEYSPLDAGKILHVLENVTGDCWICLERFHRYEKNISVQDEDNVICANDYPDMQELLAASDVLITDYSSSIWDYSFLNRPCFLYVPDLEKYRTYRGFYMDIEEWQIPFAQTEEDLMRILCSIQQIDWESRMNRHHQMLQSYETGQAAKCVVEYITNICK